eukprot:3932198-Rhodomonas_salina.1
MKDSPSRQFVVGESRPPLPEVELGSLSGPDPFLRRFVPRFRYLTEVDLAGDALPVSSNAHLLLQPRFPRLGFWRGLPLEEAQVG